MIRLTDGTIIREVHVNGGSGHFAYYIGFTFSDGFPEVGLEPEFRLNGNLAGFHFSHRDRDWIIVRGAALNPTREQLVELDQCIQTV